MKAIFIALFKLVFMACEKSNVKPQEPANKVEQVQPQPVVISAQFIADSICYPAGSQFEMQITKFSDSTQVVVKQYAYTYLPPSYMPLTFAVGQSYVLWVKAGGCASISPYFIKKMKINATATGLARDTTVNYPYNVATPALILQSPGVYRIAL